MIAYLNNNDYYDYKYYDYILSKYKVYIFVYNSNQYLLFKLNS